MIIIKQQYILRTELGVHAFRMDLIRFAVSGPGRNSVFASHLGNDSAWLVLIIKQAAGSGRHTVFYGSDLMIKHSGGSRFLQFSCTLFWITSNCRSRSRKSPATAIWHSNQYEKYRWQMLKDISRPYIAIRVMFGVINIS